MSVRTFLTTLVAATVMVVAQPAMAQAENMQEGEALRAQRANALPLTPFYDLQGADLSRAGHLIRSEAATSYDLPGGVTATRIA